MPRPDLPVVMLSASEPEAPVAALDAAAEALEAGGLVVLPTDTVYGLAVLAAAPGAAHRLAQAKSRSHEQAVAVLVADRDQAEQVGLLPAGSAADRLAASWPGPLTLVLVRRPRSGADVEADADADGRDWDLGGDAGTVGVRCPDDPFVRALARRVGPLATTSANRHGEPTPARAQDAAAALLDPVALVIDRGPCGGIPSTVVDVTGPEPVVLREAALSSAQIQALLHPNVS